MITERSVPQLILVLGSGVAIGSPAMPGGPGAPKRRFELALEVQRWTRARSECLPRGPKIIVMPLPAGDVNHKPGGRLPLLSARPAGTPATLKRAATNFTAW